MPPVISVIIPHYDDLDNLTRCLALLAAQQFDAGRYEVIVADNNSRCGIAAVHARAGDRARVVAAPEQGAGAARNAAVAAARGSLLAFIDSDCLPAPDWLQRGVAALARGDIVGGAVSVFCRTPGAPNPVEAFEMVFAFRTRDYVERQHFAVTANMFVGRAIFDRVGGFSATVAEDMDWCFRARAMGYTLVYGDDVKVAHPARANWAELMRKWRRTTRETYLLGRRRRFGRITWFGRAIIVLASPLPHLVQVWRSTKIQGPVSRLGASAILFRLRFFRFVESLRLLSSS
jgi:cellulose synthase/poly-beta-1,6-N-acetylglucosamine synthase-like glycosyltransferase